MDRSDPLRGGSVVDGVDDCYVLGKIFPINLSGVFVVLASADIG